MYAVSGLRLNLIFKHYAIMLLVHLDPKTLQTTYTVTLSSHLDHFFLIKSKQFFSLYKTHVKFPIIISTFCLTMKNQFFSLAARRFWKVTERQSLLPVAF